MKINPRALALAGLLGVLASNVVHRAFLYFEDPAAATQIIIPFVSHTVRENGKIIQIKEEKFIPTFISIYIWLFVAAIAYNRKEN